MKLFFIFHFFLLFSCINWNRLDDKKSDGHMEVVIQVNGQYLFPPAHFWFMDSLIFERVDLVIQGEDFVPDDVKRFNFYVTDLANERVYVLDSLDHEKFILDTVLTTKDAKLGKAFQYEVPELVLNTENYFYWKDTLINHMCHEIYMDTIPLINPTSPNNSKIIHRQFYVNKDLMDIPFSFSTAFKEKFGGDVMGVAIQYVRTDVDSEPIKVTSKIHVNYGITKSAKERFLKWSKALD